MGGWVVNATPWSLYPRERYLTPIVQVAGWASEQVWTGVENFAPIRIETHIIQPAASDYDNYAMFTDLFEL
jgi:hypothetical protein